MMAKKKKGATARDWAAWERQETAVQLLDQKRADIMAKNNPEMKLQKLTAVNEYLPELDRRKNWWTRARSAVSSKKV